MLKFGLEVHPGEILRQQMEELGLSANAIAARIGVPPNRISTILRGTRSITADSALRLGRFFGQTPEFWMNLQRSYDLVIAERAIGKQLKSIRRGS
jgi:antitoxin HigA-1